MAISKEKREFLIGTGTIVVALLALAAYLFFMPVSGQATLPETSLAIGSTSIEVELATTGGEQEQGLSGRNSLAQGHGMFFVFDHADKWGIWMKDMKFPIDILWANENGIIVTIEHDVPPSSYPQSFYPSADSSYVLELPAGYTQEKGIAIGQQIVLK
ncbi:MAG TPA: DUF192 domain-containing protein [Candidatus Paceibacterota bacterium]|nr:DUF192 domain-containing protein [Candidatus Paceibacterota bacterium]